MKKILISALITFLLSGCMTATQHRTAVQDNSTERMTVGTVQREIRVGMSGAKVIQALGSPNVISTDEQRREVWIYDKISSDTAYSADSGGVSALFLGTGNSAQGRGGAGYSKDSGATSESQKTLTVIIKFDKNRKVRDFAYHTSRF